MANTRGTSASDSLSYTLRAPSGASHDGVVHNGKSWDYSNTGRENEVLSLGGGSPLDSYDDFTYGFGSHVFTPKDNFIGAVNVWGAGGGVINDNGDSYSGGGGYTQVFMDFVKDTPYTIVVGEAGGHSNVRTHGGGGRGHSSGGSGGGLSGIFMDVEHTGTSPWTTSPPLSQANAVIIAGGGGGRGHHNSTTNHGQAGAGGGWLGKRAHNAQPGTQTGGGGGGYSGAAGGALYGGDSATNTSWLGGGGGGWYGGGGGGHSGSHHNGGAGGSGHHAYPSDVASQPNNGLSQFVFNGYTERGKGSYHYITGLPGNWYHPLASSPNGGIAGQGGYGIEHNSTGARPRGTTLARNGKVVITRMPDFIGKYRFPHHTDPFSNSYGQTY